MRRLIVPAALAVLAIGALFLLNRATPPRPKALPRRDPPPLPSVFSTERARIRVATLTNQLDQPWALAFLPDGDKRSIRAIDFPHGAATCFSAR